MTTDNPTTEALYGPARGRPFAAGLSAVGALTAERGVDGVWFVPFRESPEGEGGIERGATYHWATYAVDPGAADDF